MAGVVDVHSLIREEFLVSSISTKSITRHLYTRVLCGKVVIVTDKPASLLPAIRKQWLKLAHKAQVERARTLDAMRIGEVSEVIAKMQGLHFNAKWSSDPEPADVYIATIEQLLQWAPECRTMYVTCPITQEQLHLITAWIPRGGLVVIYRMAGKVGSA